MREPRTVLPSEIDSIPDRPAVFLLWAAEGQPYLARTALLRRRLRRLISERDRVSRVLNLRGVVDRIEYWITGSQLESALIHLELAQRHFPEDWPRITRLRPPVMVRLTLDNPFPRTMVTTSSAKGCFSDLSPAAQPPNTSKAACSTCFRSAAAKKISCHRPTPRLHLRRDEPLPASLPAGGFRRRISQ